MPTMKMLDSCKLQDTNQKKIRSSKKKFSRKLKRKQKKPNKNSKIPESERCFFLVGLEVLNDKAMDD